MAHAIGFTQANFIFQRPQGMTAEQCSSLEVYRDANYSISKWQFSDEEIEELKKNGGKVFIMIMMGGAQPPVYITPIVPFDQPQPKKD